MTMFHPVRAIGGFRRNPAALAVGLGLLILQGCAGIPTSAEPQAPAFTLPSADGSTVSLSDYNGKQPVLLYFHMAVG